MMWVIGVAAAATLSVGESAPYATIGDAVAVAVDGDVIAIGPGEYREKVTLEVPVTLIGTDGAAATTVINPSEGRLLVATAPVWIEGLTFDPDGIGGALEVADGSTLAALEIRNAYVPFDPGGAVLANGALTVTDTLVEDCEAWGGSGIEAKGPLRVRRSTFQDNTAAVISADDVVQVVDSTFLRNDGIALATSWTDDLEVTDSRFIANGGAVFAFATKSVRVEGCEFRGNTARSGAAIYLEDRVRGSRADIRDNVFVDNVAEVQGGAVHLENTWFYAEYYDHLRHARAFLLGNTFAGSGAPTGAHVSTGPTTRVSAVNNIFAYGHGGWGLSVGGVVDHLDHNLWFGNDGGDASVPLGASSVLADPLFIDYADDRDFDDDVAVAPGSPAIDAGTPRLVDDDGSPSDIGAR